jgi:hypothetical protein
MAVCEMALAQSNFLPGEFEVSSAKVPFCKNILTILEEQNYYLVLSLPYTLYNPVAEKDCP